MKRLFAPVIAVALFGWHAVAEDGPALPAPAKEHEWLKQFEGAWTTETEIFEKDKPSTKAKGSVSVRMIGGYWAMFEHAGDAGGTPFTGILTLGWDPEKKTYVATWIDSMTSVMWRYTGSVDAAGKTLTLDTEGPDFTNPGKTCKFRESLTFVDKDHMSYASTMELDGKWVNVLKMESTRKK